MVSYVLQIRSKPLKAAVRFFGFPFRYAPRGGRKIVRKLGRQLHNGGNILNKRRRNSFKSFFVKKPLWLTAFCLIVSMVALAGIVWIIQDTHMYQKTLTTIEGPFNRYEVITDNYLVPTGFRTKKQGNIYIDEKKYIIASDSLKTFDSKNFTENVAIGE